MTATADYLNVLIGGGQHPHRPGGTIPVPDTHFFHLEPNPAFATFEISYNGLIIVPLASLGWNGTGDFASAHYSTNFFTGQLGAAVLDTCIGRCDARWIIDLTPPATRGERPAKGSIRLASVTRSNAGDVGMPRGGRTPGHPFGWVV